MPIDCAFGSCRKLTSVTIGDGVTSIGDGAFYGCTSLVKIYYNGSVNDWVQIDGLYSLMNYGNSNKELYMRDVLLVNTIIDTATEIKSYAFYNCASLTSVTIPDSVTSIGNYAFEGCGQLNYNEYGNALYLGNDSNPFVVLSEPKTYDITSCEINGNCKTINSGALALCESLTNISVDENNKNYKSIDGNLYSKDGKTLIQYAIGKTDTAFTIPDSVTSIGECAFSSCNSLTRVTIPDSVTSIGDGAFYHCTSLTSITIPDGVTSIGDHAFDGCISLTSVTIGKGVKSIGKKAFYSCYSIEAINYKGSKEQWASISKGSDWNYGTGSFTINYNYVEN